MKTKTLKYSIVTAALTIALVVVTSCERDPSDETQFANFPNTGDIFTDAPVSLTDEFFVSFDPAVGANTQGFGTDDNEAFEGTSSIRIDVPAANDPNGGFIGGIFLDRGEGRNLTGYDALTFYAKGSTTATIGTVGFGTDFEDNKFAVSTDGIQLSTDWQKYVIPIPDPSKLVQERGMFLFSAGGLDIVDDIPNGNEIGYTFWIDELRFENLGTVAQPRPQIFNGQDITETSFIGSTVSVTGLTQTFNLGTGVNQTVNASPLYFDFSSSDTSVAVVNAQGETSIVGEGTATITARIAGVLAQGSLEITSSGALETAPDPTLPDANVSSIYSDTYTSVTAINFSPGFGGSTTQTIELESNGNNFLSYTNNNFTGVIFDNTVDASALSFMHVDIYTPDAGTEIEFQIRDIGSNGEIETNPNNGFPIGDDLDKRFTATGLNVGEWTSFDIPLDGDLANQKDNLGAIIIVGGASFFLDNIYFYTE